jgi:hypothetical protein
MALAPRRTQQERVMTGNISAVIEEEVWRDMARIADRMSRNPRVRVEAEVDRTRAHLQTLKRQRQHEVELLRSRLNDAPHDQEAKLQLAQDTERLDDLRIAEVILTALAD